MIPPGGLMTLSNDTKPRHRLHVAVEKMSSTKTPKQVYCADETSLAADIQ
jgi:hypothetical protein